MNFFETSALSLAKIRSELVRLEDSIIFALIERCQFAHNPIIYDEGGIEFNNDFEGSFLSYFLHQIEIAHAKVRRYTSPDELPFTRDLPDPILPPLCFPKLLIPNNINVNAELLDVYIHKIVPFITKPGDDQNYGSAATKDCEALQLLSRRIHFGRFVAEAKFNDPCHHDEYVELIKKRDRQGIEDLLTNKAVEDRLLRRLRKKASVYGKEVDEETPPSTPKQVASASRLPVDVVVNMYKEFVIPLTKQVEIEYLLVRLDYPDFKPEL